MDADGDGEGSLMELMHAWTFQWGGCADCDDDLDDDEGDDGDDGDEGGDDGDDIGTTSHNSSHLDVELSVLDSLGDLQSLPYYDDDVLDDEAACSDGSSDESDHGSADDRKAARDSLLNDESEDDGGFDHSRFDLSRRSSASSATRTTARS